MVHGHHRADVRSLYLHRAALEKLRQEPEQRQACLRLVEQWLAVPDQPAARWLVAWREMLTSWPFERLQAVLLDEAGGQTLRQCSPLGPLLTPPERWRVLEEANRAIATSGGDTP